MRLNTIYRATNGYISFLAIKGMQIELSLKCDSALYKDFVRYYVHYDVIELRSISYFLQQRIVFK